MIENKNTNGIAANKARDHLAQSHRFARYGEMLIVCENAQELIQSLENGPAYSPGLAQAEQLAGNLCVSRRF